MSEKFTQGDAEAELLELIRLQDAKNFRLTISSDEKGWMVKTENTDSGLCAVGRGDYFARAWFDQTGDEFR